MTWTTERPDEPGYYWIRNVKLRYGPESEATEHGPFVVKLDENEIHFTEDEYSMDGSWVVVAEWYGPIEPPK